MRKQFSFQRIKGWPGFILSFTKKEKKIVNFLREKYCPNSTKIKEGIHFFMYSTTTLLLQAMST